MIKVGDLVWVADLPSCGCPHALGSIFHVTAFNDAPFSGCVHCGADRVPALAAWGDPSGWSVEVWRLRRIPPLEELDEVKKEEAVHV